MKIFTTKTLQRLLVTGALMLLINGCDDTVSVEQNTSVGSEVNVTVTPTTVNPTVLSLSVGATTLNKTDHANLTLMGSYADGSTKPVETQAEWIVLPTGSVEVNGTTLTALKDGNVTVQAKVGTTLSNAITLNITWIVNGHTLPPEPDKALNDSTLLGIDTNNNGVRDDVERWIYETYKDKHPIYIDIAMQAGRAYKQVLETPERAKEIRESVNAPYFCGAYYQNDAKYVNGKILVYERIDAPVKSKYFNTKKRKDAYWQYDSLLSGDSYDIPWPSEQKGMCDFNTSKYEE